MGLESITLPSTLYLQGENVHFELELIGNGLSLFWPQLDLHDKTPWDNYPLPMNF